MGLARCRGLGGNLRFHFHLEGRGRASAWPEALRDNAPALSKADRKRRDEIGQRAAILILASEGAYARAGIGVTFFERLEDPGDHQPEHHEEDQKAEDGERQLAENGVAARE